MKSKRINFKSEKGVTLVEVLLSVALLVIIAGPLLGAVYSSVWNNVAAKEKVEAVAMAEKAMEEVKAQGVIGKTTGFVAVNEDTSKNLAAYYNIEVESSGKVEPATSTVTPEDKSYKAKIEAANDADFVLEIDQNKENDGLVNLSFKDNTPGHSPIALTDFPVNKSLNLKIDISGGSVLKNYTFSTNNRTFIYSEASGITLKVTYKNGIHNSNECIRIITSIPDEVKFIPYVLDDNQKNPSVTFSNNYDSKADYDVEYLDSTYFNYRDPINDLFRITVEIRKKVTGNVVYRMSSYVKK